MAQPVLPAAPASRDGTLTLLRVAREGNQQPGLANARPGDDEQTFTVQRRANQIMPAATTRRPRPYQVNAML
jgi:hypothetical protein